MSKSTPIVIVILVLVAVLAASGCTGGSSNSNKPAVVQPRTVGDMYDMSYFWNDVNHCRLAYDMSSYMGSVGAYTFDFNDRAFNGTPAREMIMSMEGNAGYNLTMDLYFKKTSDSTNLTLLGGHVRMPDYMSDEPGAMIDVPITPEMLEAEARVNTDDLPQEYQESPELKANPYDPSYDNGFSFDSTHVTIDLKSVASLEDKEMDLAPLTYVRTETLNVGGKSYACSVYNASFTGLQLINAIKNGSDVADVLYAAGGGDAMDIWTGTVDPDKYDEKAVGMTYWYSPEFPAMPLKYVYTLNNGKEMVFTVEDFR